MKGYEVIFRRVSPMSMGDKDDILRLIIRSSNIKDIYDAIVDEHCRLARDYPAQGWMVEDIKEVYTEDNFDDNANLRLDKLEEKIDYRLKKIEDYVKLLVESDTKELSRKAWGDLMYKFLELSKEGEK